MTASTTVTDIAANLQAVRERIARAAARAGRDPAEVTIVGATKTISPETIALAHAAGLRECGENWVQEAQPKITALSSLQPRPTWHLIGRLQTNKVNAALRLFDVIQTVDSLRLGQAIAKRATHPITVLVEVNVAGEATKGGVLPQDTPDLVAALQALPHLVVAGLMTVAPLAQDPEEVRPVFRRLRELRDRCGLTALSMGMTDDFEVAVEEGATIVRIGRAIFGPRPPARGGEQ
ncbi:MAG: YggS family pyridoxal phosphate-dependent enzyme [Chloroflexi bacterium]|nr:YggS family pyridoxal phosphate-dependent enzyme [Chloroflexota bacterium]